MTAVEKRALNLISTDKCGTSHDNIHLQADRRHSVCQWDPEVMDGDIFLTASWFVPSSLTNTPSSKQQQQHNAD